MTYKKKTARILLIPYIAMVGIFFLLSVLQEVSIIGRINWLIVLTDFAMDIVFLSLAFGVFGYFLNKLYASEARLLNSNNTLSETNYELDSFIYRASHDFRTPLTNIKGLLIAYELDKTPESAEMYLAMLREATDMLDNRLLELMEITTNKHKMVTNEKIILMPFIKELINDFSFTISLDKIDIAIDGDKDIAVYSDRTRLKILLRNILTNAVKYRDVTKKKHRIRLSILQEEGQIQIVLWDNGVGIKEEILPKVYEMFYRGNELSNGSGLGLYIAKTIAITLGYDIQISSQAGEWTNVVLGLKDENSSSL